ncbi:MAG: hypothetical protein IPK37_08660 [Austwickia sp.]|jgi:hypothetical protein|nr:MAG: hypothetical protein IPK37_08660 [Austwickia sp.]
MAARRLAPLGRGARRGRSTGSAVLGVVVAGSLLGGMAGWAPAASYAQGAVARVAEGGPDEGGTPERLATPAGRGRATKGTRGFVPVRRLVDRPIAGVSPSRGELWLVENSGPAEPIRLEHLKSGRWSTTEIAPPGSRPGGIAMAATARDDVWLSAAGTLRRYDGATWTPVVTPKGPDGTPMAASALTTPSRGTLYAALRAGWRQAPHIYRYAQGRWTDLGAPVPDSLTYFSPEEIVVVEGGLSVLARIQRVHEAFDYVDGCWTAGTRVAFGDGGQSSMVGGFYVDSSWRHLAVGGDGSLGSFPACKIWSARGEEPCVSSVLTSASAQLKNGSIILGGYDYTAPKSPFVPGPARFTEGSFALRSPSGAERPIPGDPGQGTELVIAERNQNTAWAVTFDFSPTGPVYTLQRYDG